MRGISVIALAVIAGTSLPAHGDSVPTGVQKSIRAADVVKQVRKSFEKRVEMLGKTQETQTPFNGVPIGDGNDSDTYNASGSVFAYHAYRGPTCEQFNENKTRCLKHRAEGITGHEGQGTASALENLVAKKHREKLGGEPPKSLVGDTVNLGIYEIKSKGGGDVLDDGKLDKENVLDMTIVKDVQKDIGDISQKAAKMMLDRAVEKDPNGDNGSGNFIAAAPEKYRKLALDAVESLDRYLVVKIAESAMANKGIEVLLGDGMETGEKYMEGVNKNSSDNSGDEKLAEQAPLDQDTYDGLEERVKKADEIRKSNVMGPMPSEGGENYDQKLYRGALHAVRHAGASAGEIAGVAGMEIGEDRVNVGVAKWNDGARGFKEQAETNAKTLINYNQMNVRALASMENIKARTSNIDAWEPVAAINPSEFSIAAIDGYTPDQVKSAREGGVKPAAVANRQANSWAELDQMAQAGPQQGGGSSSLVISASPN